MTFKQIAALPYGTPDQMTAADVWYNRFMAFRDRHDALITDAVWDSVHLSDVGYQARRRWLEGQCNEG